MPGLKHTGRVIWKSQGKVARHLPILERCSLSRFDPCHSGNKSATPLFAKSDANNPERWDQQGFTIRLENIRAAFERNTCNTVTMSIVLSRAPKNGGWGARIRTWECRYQKPVPYRLATPQREAGEIATLTDSGNTRSHCFSRNGTSKMLQAANFYVACSRPFTFLSIIGKVQFRYPRSHRTEFAYP